MTHIAKTPEREVALEILKRLDREDEAQRELRLTVRRLEGELAAAQERLLTLQTRNDELTRSAQEKDASFEEQRRKLDHQRAEQVQRELEIKRRENALAKESEAERTIRESLLTQAQGERIHLTSLYQLGFAAFALWAAPSFALGTGMMGSQDFLTRLEQHGGSMKPLSWLLFVFFVLSALVIACRLLREPPVSLLEDIGVWIACGIGALVLVLLFGGIAVVRDFDETRRIICLVIALVISSVLAFVSGHTGRSARRLKTTFSLVVVATSSLITLCLTSIVLLAKFGALPELAGLIVGVVGASFALVFGNTVGRKGPPSLREGT